MWVRVRAPDRGGVGTPHSHKEIVMFQQQENRQHFARGLISTGVALLTLILGTGAMPAAARQDPGPIGSRGAHVGECSLQRVATQYVRCDSNTGNGVLAAAWIPER